MIALRKPERHTRRIQRLASAVWPMMATAPILVLAMQPAAFGQGPPVTPDAYFFWNGPGGSADNPTSGDVSDPNNWNYGPSGAGPTSPPPPPGADEIAQIATNSDTAPITITGSLDALGIGISGPVLMTGPVAAGLDGLGTGADVDLASTFGPTYTNTVTSASDLACVGGDNAFESTSSVNITGASVFYAASQQDTIDGAPFTGGGGVIIDNTVGLYGGATMTADTNTPGELLPDSVVAFYSPSTALQVSGDFFITGSTVTCNGDAVFGANSTYLSLVDVNSGGNLTTTGVTHIGVNDPYNDDDNDNPGSAVVIVGGAGSEWEAEDDVRVGDDDDAGGSVFIQDGGILQLDADVNVRLGSDAGGSGVLVFDGTSGTPYLFAGNSTSIIVGDAGYGGMDVQNGASIIHGGTLVVGNEDTSTGVLSITGDGSSLLVANDVYVGYSGMGAANINDGGTLTVVNLTIGSEDSGNGTVNVGTADEDSAGSLVDLSTLTVGDSGTGELTADSGSTVQIDGLAVLGSEEDSSGTITVGPDDSAEITFSENLTVGGGGAGFMDIEPGSTLTVNGGTFTIGQESTGSGTVSLDGSTLSFTGALIIGDAGSGELTMDLGATNTLGASLAAPSVTLGNQADSDGTLTMEGTGTSLQVSHLIVGQSGQGTLAISDGAVLTCAGELDIAAKSGGMGTVTVSGTGSMLATNTLAVGGTVAAAGGSGSLTVNDFAHLSVTGALVVWSGGQVNLNAPSATVGNLSIEDSGLVNLNGTLLVDYGTSISDPISSIASYLKSGYAGGKWNGTYIVSTTVAALDASQSKLAYSLGYADGADRLTSVPSGDIEILPTLAGDAKLQGNVNFGDFQLLAQYFGHSSTTWDEGDFTYNGTTNFGDFQLLAQDFGSTNSALTAGELSSLNSFAAQFGDVLLPNPSGGFRLVSVPEPASAASLASGAAAILLKRRRARRTKC